MQSKKDVEEQIAEAQAEEQTAKEEVAKQVIQDEAKNPDEAPKAGSAPRASK